MHDYAVESGCKIVCDTANALILEDGAVIGVKCEENTYYADSVIICCGGKSYPLTGSTGDGYTLAKQAGHTIVPLKPSLVPFTSGDKQCKDMQGLALKNVALRIVDKNSKKGCLQRLRRNAFYTFRNERTYDFIGKLAHP